MHSSSKHFATILFLVSALFAFSSDHQSTLELQSGWELAPAKLADQKVRALFGNRGSIPAKVPGTILTSLESAGRIPNPLFGTNILKLPDALCRTPYMYSEHFVVPAKWRDRFLTLRVNGVNYRATFTLNGHHLGTIIGAFERKDFNISGVVNRTGENNLTAEVWPQPHPGIAHLKTIATGTGRNGGITALDGPTFFCSIGWDWIPTVPDRDTGIWQPIQLLASGPIKLSQPFVRSNVRFKGGIRSKETVSVTASNLSNKAIESIITGQIEGHVFKTKALIKPYSHRIIKFQPNDFPALSFRSPRLWQPNGYGKPNLYNLNLAAFANGISSDSISTRFGIRKIAYQYADSPNLTLVVNNVPIIAKGGDWGMDDALKNLTPERMNAMIRMHAEANYTIIRNWCGQSTSPLLYHYCDKYGILIWDEFFQPNPSDGPNPADIPTYIANVKAKILRYRIHPSIALWCARNEGNPPKAINDANRSLIARYDPQSLYQPSSTSGRGVRSGGPYFWRTPAEFYRFRTAFKTEIGSMSVPTLQAIQAMLPKKDWNHINDDWAQHDFCKGAQRGGTYINTMTSRYGAPTNLPDFARKAQMMNYEAFRAMYEGRLVKLLSPTTGIITWMSNPAQNSFVWQIYSHDLEPNASLFGAKKACEVIHVMLNQATGNVDVINGSPHQIQGKVIETVMNLSGKVASKQILQVSAKRLKVIHLGALNLGSASNHVHLVELRFLNKKSEPISSNFYWAGSSATPNNLLSLSKLKTLHLNISGNCHFSHHSVHITLRVKNPSNIPALMVHLQLRDSNGNRILPVFYSNNYVNLGPKERQTITMSAPIIGKVKNGVEVFIEGWNVVQKSRPISSQLKIVGSPLPPKSGTWPLG